MESRREVSLSLALFLSLSLARSLARLLFALEVESKREGWSGSPGEVNPLVSKKPPYEPKQRRERGWQKGRTGQGRPLVTQCHTGIQACPRLKSDGGMGVSSLPSLIPFLVMPVVRGWQG